MSHSLIVVRKDITRDYFLKSVGAVSGHAAELFSRIYDAIFSEAINVDELYEKYYSVEYDDVRSFMYHKYCIDYDIIDQLEDVKNQNPNNIVVAIYDFAYSKSNIIDFAFSDQMYDRITNLLLMNPHENKN